MKRCLWGEYVEWLYFNVKKLEKIQGTKRKIEKVYKDHIASLNQNKSRKRRKKEIIGSIIKEEELPPNPLVKLEEKEQDSTI